MDWSKFNQASKIAKSLRANPNLGLASISAGLIAPTLISNDDRGYFSSSVITTPLIAAAYSAAPKIKRIMKDEVPKTKNFFKHIPTRVMSKGPKSYEDITAQAKEFSEGGMRTRVFNKSLGNYYVTQPAASKFDVQASQLRARLFDVPAGVDFAARTRYLENVVHAEALRNLPTNQLAQYVKKVGPVAPSIGMDGVRSMIEQQIGNRNESFVKAMGFHMQKMNGMVYNGVSTISKDTFDATEKIAPRTYRTEWGGNVSDTLKSARPDLYEAVQSQISKGIIKPQDITVVTRNSAHNSIIGLQVSGTNIPIVGEGGRIVGGKNWDKLGVSRGIFTSQDKYNADTFAINNWGLGIDKVKSDLARANIINGADQTEDFSAFTPKDYESVSSGSELDTRIKAQQMVASDITGFGPDGTTGFNKLNAYQMEETVGKLDQLGLIKSGSEKMSGVFEDGVMSRASYYGLQNPSRQNPWTRALSKDVRLGNTVNAPKPYMMPDLFAEMVPDEVLPVVGVRQGGVSAAQRTFFAQLPSNVADLHSYENEAINMLMDKHKMNPNSAKETWKRMSKWLSDPINLSTMRKSQALGEGSKLAQQNLFGMNVTRLHNFEVDEHIFGDNPIDHVGRKLTSDEILGFAGGNPITADGAENYLENITQLENGKYSVSVRENFGFGQGTKIDLDAGTRGLIGDVFNNDKESEIYAKGLSMYNQLTMSGPQISSESRVFGLLGSEAAKGDPINTTINTAVGALREMSNMNQTDIVDKYKPLLRHRGIDIETGLFDSKQFSTLGRTGGVVEFKRTQSVINDLMEEAGARIRKLAITFPAQLNETGRAFAATNPASRWGKLDEFFIHSGAFQNMTAWNSTALNAPGQVKATIDILQDLSLSGHYGAVKDILSRVEYDGNPEMTRQMAEYVSGDKGAIPNRISMREALNGKTKNVRLSTASGREGSIFDKDNPFAQNNFVVDLPDGSNIPVLGHEAYGGKVNQFGVGEFSASDRERGLRDIFKAYEDNKTPEEIAKAKQAYMEGTETRAGLHDVLFGKKSFLRASAIDPLAQGGFLQSRDSNIRLSTGEINPFQFKVSVDYARNLKNKELSETLLNGGTAHGVLARYPVSYATMGQIVVDKSLKPNEIGVDIGATPFIRGDYDQDSGYLFAFEPGSQGEKEAMTAVAEGSAQHKSLAILQSQETEMFEELARNHGIDGKSLIDRTKRFTDDYIRTPQIHKQRLVSRTIGEYSNTRSIMLDMLEQSETITNPEERDSLRHLFFNPYQSPISAAKAKAGSEITYEGARTLNSRLLESLDGGSSFPEFKSALNNVLQFAPESVQRTAQDSTDLLERFHSSISADTFRASKAKIASLEGAFAKVDIGGSLLAADLIKYSGGAYRATKETSTAAKMGAEALGAINEGYSTAKRVAEAFSGSEAKKAVGLGLGIAAVAGLMTTTTSSPRAKSTNNYRPEEVASTANHVPGDSGTGSYSHNPPKTLVSNNTPNVSRAVVAPINQSTDVEVDMRTDDQSRATETSKMVARSSGSGQTIVTNNYKNNNLTSLRNKQKLRERLDESN